jgi:hypothetical protein
MRESRDVFLGGLVEGIRNSLFDYYLTRSFLVKSGPIYL